MFTKFKIYEALDSVDVNSEKEVKKRDIAKKINEFNSKKGSLNNILTLPVDKWEEAAEKIIIDNVYLSIHWRYLKNKYDLDLLKRSSYPSDREAAQKRNESISRLEKDINELEQELKQKLEEDKKTLV